MSLSLGQKIQIAVIGIVAGLSILLGFFFPLRQQQQLQESFERATHSLAVTVALGVEIGLSNGNFSAMQNAIDFARQDAELAYVAVTNEAGAVEASFPADLQLRDVPDQAVVSRRARVSTPIFDGEVIVGRSTGALQASVHAVRWTAAWVSLLAIVLGSMAAVGLARYIARPIRALRDAAERVGAGDLNQHVALTSDDEVGELANAFNAMVDDIRTYVHEARTAARAKSEFLATMSHEIRTPLNGVTGMVQLLHDTPLSAKQQHYVEVIQTSSDSLLAIINDILDLSKIESGRLELEDEPFDVVETVEHVLDLMAPKAASKGIELVSRVGASVPEAVRGDATRVRQVVLNLLSNAVKFTHQGEVLVVVEAEWIERVDATGKEGWRVTVIVQDTGIGIPADKQDRLFKKFTQADASTTRKYGGTGLGLSICKQLCTLMNGRIEVESQEGQGTTFRASFIAGPVEDVAPYAQPDPALRGCRVLIIDDNATSRSVLTGRAQAWGMEAHAVGTVDAATRWLQNHSVDVLVVDRDVAEQAAEQLKRPLAYREETPSIVLLAPLGTAPPSHIAGLPVTSTHKPVKHDAFRQAIRGALGAETTTQHAARVSSSARVRFARTAEAHFDLRVLVAEDNAINQMVMREMLTRLGCDVVMVTDGAEASDAAGRDDFDLILMDVQMPKVDGFEATRQIDARCTDAERPHIAALTAYEMDERQDEAEAAGMDDILVKPVEPDQLVALLRRVQGRSGNAPADPPDALKAGTESPPTPADIRATLREHVGSDDPALFNALLTRFLQTVPETLQSLHSAGQERDVGSVEHAAHSFRTSCATVGAAATAASAHELEQLCRNGASWNEISAQIQHLTQSARRAEQTIRTMVADDGP
jgi:signal transduction histidine kinase/CheY-like chemotaxis protein